MYFLAQLLHALAAVFVAGPRALGLVNFSCLSFVLLSWQHLRNSQQPTGKWEMKMENGKFSMCLCLGLQFWGQQQVVQLFLGPHSFFHSYF